jgi:hypothetical protein
MIRSITGYGSGNGPYITIHDGFFGLSTWAGFLPGSDRIILDTHPYFAFDGVPNSQPFAVPGPDGLPGGIWPQQACTWGPNMNTRFVFAQDCSKLTHLSFSLQSVCFWRYIGGRV